MGAVRADIRPLALGTAGASPRMALGHRPGTGRHRLGLQGLQMVTGGHFRRHHAADVFLQGKGDDFARLGIPHLEGPARESFGGWIP